MGNGIAHVAALAGRSVNLVDLSAPLAERGRAAIEKNLARQVEKGKLTAEARDAALARISTAATSPRSPGPTFVVEAVRRERGRQERPLRALDRLLKKEALLASNTSSISVTRLAAATSRPRNSSGCTS